MKKILILAFVLVLAFTSLTLTACEAFIEAFNEGFHGTPDEETQTVNSSESELSMEFPKSWKKETLHEDASVQMGHLAREQYMMVFEEPVSDFPLGFTLGDYADVILESMADTVDTDSAPSIKNTQIGGISAKQFEISGTVDDLEISYLVTMIEHDGMIYQFCAWVLEKRYEYAKPIFDSILDSIDF